MSTAPESTNASCSLLLLVATPAEEKGLRAAATEFGLPFERIRGDRSRLGIDYYWLGEVGNETVIAIPPARTRGKVVMGSIGFLGTAARGMRLRTATGAQGIVQLGMAFGVSREREHLGDVLVSTSIIPYDNRDIRPAQPGVLCRLFCVTRYATDYSFTGREPARPALVELFRREARRNRRTFDVHFGAMLSGGARIRSHVFRDELVRGVSVTEELVVGGEMEGVGLLAASVGADNPVWCVVKGISDFADEMRDDEIEANRPIACRNAATFVISALRNDAATALTREEERS